ncbi:MAG: T9SS type A sorting domain-containing protein [Bacteroidia bacterium]|nr:T9SS type A sorting domain-containing protein [Bacteroidia bacterium]
MNKIKLISLLYFLINQNGFSQTIYTYAGFGPSGYFGNGVQATTALLSNPKGVTIDATGNIYICDTDNSCVRKVNVSGIITTIAGIPGSSGYSGDGGSALAAKLYAPNGIALDASGNIYVADGNVIRKINTTGTITTIAGTGIAGVSGDGGLATSAELNAPTSVAIDGAGNIYVSDNSSRVRKINSSGIINTVAGNGTAGYSGDGGLATTAQLYSPVAIAIDGLGNLYIADDNNNCIRKVNTTGNITTIAGDGTSGFFGDGSLATSSRLSSPRGITMDVNGNIFISDRGNHRIRKINTSGIISTISGDGNASYNGSGIPAASATINTPYHLITDVLGNIYFCDLGNQRIRSICFTSCLAGINDFNFNTQVKIYPNPVSNTMHVDSEQYFEDGTEIEISNTLGQTVLKLPNNSEIDVSNISNGCYILQITTSDNQRLYSKFVKQ